MKEKEECHELSLQGFLLEQEKKTRETIDFLTYLKGTFDAEKNTEIHFLKGYLTGIMTVLTKLTG